MTHFQFDQPTQNQIRRELSRQLTKRRNRKRANIQYWATVAGLPLGLLALAVSVYFGFRTTPNHFNTGQIAQELSKVIASKLDKNWITGTTIAITKRHAPVEPTLKELDIFDPAIQQVYKPKRGISTRRNYASLKSKSRAPPRSGPKIIAPASAKIPARFQSKSHKNCLSKPNPSHQCEVHHHISNR